MKIPVFSSTIRRKEMDAVLTCMVAERVGPGEMNQRFSQTVKESLSFEGAGVFRSASIALAYACNALNLTAGSGIIISALAPAWHYHAVSRLGYNPIVADVDAETAVVTADSLKNAVDQGGRLILLHETLGFVPDMPSILALNIPVIEDISQSVGTFVNEKPVGTFGIFSILGLEDRDLLTAGGGALLLAANKREAIVLKKLVDEAPKTDILPDINAALAWVQFKELGRNSQTRKEMHSLFLRSLMQGRHKTIIQGEEVVSSVYGFPVILSSGLKEVRQYATKKDIEIEEAFSDSVLSVLGDDVEGFINAKSLSMRCVLFPLYPRLGSANVAKISKILATLP